MHGALCNIYLGYKKDKTFIIFLKGKIWEPVFRNSGNAFVFYAYRKRKMSALHIQNGSPSNVRKSISWALAWLDATLIWCSNSHFLWEPGWMSQIKNNKTIKNIIMDYMSFLLIGQGLESNITVGQVINSYLTDPRKMQAFRQLPACLKEFLSVIILPLILGDARDYMRLKVRLASVLFYLTISSSVCCIKKLQKYSQV